jgi:hypothetical protein
LKFAIGLIEIPLAWLGSAVLVLDVEEIDSILHDPFCIGESIYGEKFADENFTERHTGPDFRWPTVDPTPMDRRFGTYRYGILTSYTFMNFNYLYIFGCNFRNAPHTCLGPRMSGIDPHIFISQESPRYGVGDVCEIKMWGVKPI